MRTPQAAFLFHTQAKTGRLPPEHARPTNRQAASL